MQVNFYLQTTPTFQTIRSSSQNVQPPSCRSRRALTKTSIEITYMSETPGPMVTQYPQPPLNHEFQMPTRPPSIHPPLKRPARINLPPRRETVYLRAPLGPQQGRFVEPTPPPPLASSHSSNSFDSEDFSPEALRKHTDNYIPAPTNRLLTKRASVRQPREPSRYCP